MALYEPYEDASQEHSEEIISKKSKQRQRVLPNEE